MNVKSAHRFLRELKILRILRGHKNIVKLLTIMRPSDSQNFDKINLVFEFCEINLSEMINLHR